MRFHFHLFRAERIRWTSVLRKLLRMISPIPVSKVCTSYLSRKLCMVYFSQCSWSLTVQGKGKGEEADKQTDRQGTR